MMSKKIFMEKNEDFSFSSAIINDKEEDKDSAYNLSLNDIVTRY